MKDEALVLGIGNILWADEGFGIRAAEALHAKFEMPDGVRITDGGTQGIFLLPLVRSAKRLLIFDAVDFGDPPATLKLIVGDEVPRFMGVRKMSMHQAGFQEVLASAELAGELPGELALIGVQPELLDDYGGSLRPSVREQIGPAIRLAEQVLERWGFELRPRTSPPEELVGPGALDIRDYEEGRPLINGEPS
ncbi:MAG: HyaD/HybD family hydrogenase maturation endopeptidase [Gammaproteobacteria bacterium]|nr:HyaD/HybD family hydrogenase maturation endopeptidase [Gammaproteobacteria bacterium]MBT8094115.1 HyaD/HybD family hydrogenase maturation endopeptidase [Gammaproteobacteria bacterium]MBT8105848.1 HyaD/HybD family hydrogenase maturation endopeptidase [Gammaproteobacteria bacterium]